jgi:hypothetical protein
MIYNKLSNIAKAFLELTGISTLFFIEMIENQYKAFQSLHIET